MKNLINTVAFIRGNTVFQAVVQQNVRKWQAPGRRAEQYGVATIREAETAVCEVLGRLLFKTAAFRGWYEATATGRHFGKRWKTDLVARRLLRRRKSEESCHISVVK